MAAINAIAREWADEIRDGIAWVIVWKTGRSWNAQAVWLNSDTDTFEPEDLELARKILEKDPKAVMVNGYYCGHFGEDMTVAELAAGIRWHYENGCNMLDGSTAFPPEPMERPADLPADLPWYGKATSAEPDPYVYDGYMNPEDYELMHKHMEANRQQEKETRAAPGDLYIDGKRFTGQIAELTLPRFSLPELNLPELRSPPSMELTLTITPDTAAAILEALQPAALRFLEAVAKAAKKAWEWLKQGAAKAAKIAARWADKCMDTMLYRANDKEGGILTQPTIFGASGNNLLAGGEAGAEAVVPLATLWEKLDTMIHEVFNSASSTGGTSDAGLTSKAGELLTLDNFSLGSLADSGGVVVYYDFSGFTWSPQIQTGNTGDGDDDLMAQLKAHEAEFFDWLEEFIQMREVAQYA